MPGIDGGEAVRFVVEIILVARADGVFDGMRCLSVSEKRE